MIRGLAYASCYVYSPSGAGVACEHSRWLRSLLKAGDAKFMDKYAARVRQQTCEAALLGGFFGNDDLLIPVPGSRPYVAGALWVAQILALALVNAGLASTTWPGLHRACAVRKSATAAPGSRPTVTSHYESFAVDSRAPCVDHIVLIDDVVTKGRTLLAAATRVQEAFPHADIRAFALLRTMGMVAGVTQLLDPCTGRICWNGGDAHRTP